MLAKVLNVVAFAKKLKTAVCFILKENSEIIKFSIIFIKLISWKILSDHTETLIILFNISCFTKSEIFIKANQVHFLKKLLVNCVYDLLEIL